MNILQQILNDFPDEGFMKAVGFDSAIIGYCSGGRLVYSVDKVIDILMKDMTEEEAIEFFEFKIECAYIGEQTPIFIKLIN